jgi:hypothetical protein
MWTVLRVIGVANAAIWLGGSVFFTLAAAPAVFQPEMKRLFQDYYVGLVAQMLQERYFSFQVVCGAVALAHGLVEWLAGRRPRTMAVLGVLAVLYSIVLAGAFWFVPHLASLHKTRHTAASAAERQQAVASFRAWHGLSQGLNLVLLGGLGFYFWRTVSPSPASAFMPGQPHLFSPLGVGRGPR